MNTAKPIERTMQHVHRKGIVRPRDLEALGIPREYLLRLDRQGKLSRTGRGIYTLPDAAVTERHCYAVVAKRVPEAVLCRLSALAFHELTTQSPAEVWIALGNGAKKPAILPPSLQVVRLTEPSLCERVEEHAVEGVSVRVYSAAKTVADCFKFRNKIGLDIAIKALKDCLRQNKATINEIYPYAKICRVNNVIRPYREALCPAHQRRNRAASIHARLLALSQSKGHHYHESWADMRLNGFCIGWAARPTATGW
jgi:predicted transcriptional regulator of viral defense system